MSSAWSIIRPRSKGRLRKLRIKLAEYGGRLRQLKKEYGCSLKPNSPGIFERLDTISKIELLKRVLRNGKVMYDEPLGALDRNSAHKLLARELSGSSAYVNAFNVIRNYCHTGGKNAVGRCLPD